MVVEIAKKSLSIEESERVRLGLITESDIQEEWRTSWRNRKGNKMRVSLSDEEKGKLLEGNEMSIENGYSEILISFKDEDLRTHLYWKRKYFESCGYEGRDRFFHLCKKLGFEIEVQFFVDKPETEPEPELTKEEQIASLLGDALASLGNLKKSLKIVEDLPLPGEKLTDKILGTQESIECLKAGLLPFSEEGMTQNYYVIPHLKDLELAEQVKHLFTEFVVWVKDDDPVLVGSTAHNGRFQIGEKW